MRILIVEDRADCADSTALLLSMYGHQCETVSDGMTALEVEHARQHDVVILDIGLPGLNGWEVAKQIKAHSGPNPFLIAMTGFGRDEDRRRSLNSGIDLHLTKPADPEMLVELLRNLAISQRQSQFQPCETAHCKAVDIRETVESDDFQL